METFIRTWPNKVSKELCQTAIDFFEETINDSNFANLITNNSKQFNNNLGRKDLSFFLEEPSLNQAYLCDTFLNILHECFLEYIEEFGQLKELNLSNQYCLKFQRTLPMGGYHTWHYESAAGATSWNRELAWMIYLNDMPDNEAETEFIYQAKRVKSTCGTLVIWPAGMTHVHRGNPVYSHPKYILTGWYHKK